MKEIVYQEIDWNKKREETMKLNKGWKYNPRIKDVIDAYEMEFTFAMQGLQCGLKEVASNHVNNAKKYLEKSNSVKKFQGLATNEKIEDIFGYYFILYYVSWLDGSVDREAVSVLTECLEMEYINKIKSRAVFKESVQMTNVSLSVRLGLFELAKTKIQKYAKIKTATIDNETIYDFYKFYLIFVEYLQGIGTVSREEMDGLFLKIFSEHQKGNRTVFYAYGGIIGIYDVYYSYYKYFLELPEEELTAENVFESCEKGILHWRKK